MIDTQTQFDIDPTLIESQCEFSRLWQQIERYHVFKDHRKEVDREDCAYDYIDTGDDVEAKQGEYAILALFKEDVI